MTKYNGNLMPYARALRRNMTAEERHLWYDFLRDYPVRFVRQKVLGAYIADFYCAAARLAVELDGSQHCAPEAAAYDRRRTEALAAHGVRVLRIPNNALHANFPGVCEAIDRAVKGPED